ncbi:MAG TPA: urea ABC transporter permease subunit UrtC, partial [Plasticicumulans sp.]|nr:urea ABC transporter permease subunit UrtC [Plasticicumulans sp.]
MHGIRNLHTTRGWVGFFVVAALLLVAVPVLNALPETNPLHVPDWLIPLAGKFCCYALVALAMDLIWGYTGILSLGH